LAPPSTGPFTDITAAYGLDQAQAPQVAGFDTDCEVARFMTAGAAVVDINEDGWPDLYLPRLDLADRLMINLQGEGFEDRATEYGLDLGGDSGAPVFFDRDGDGDLDLLLSSPTTNPRLFDRQGPRFVPVPDAAGLTVDPVPQGECSRMFGASLGDPDGDGDLDLITAAWLDSGRSHLFINDGQGRFQQRSAEWGLQLDEDAVLTPVFVDLDADGDEDLVAISDFADTRIFDNRGGRFVDITQTSTLARIHDGMGADLGDVDGDGRVDLFVGGICFERPSGCLDASGWTGNHLFMNRGGGEFESQAAQAGVQRAGWAWGSTFFDPDLDGDLDLAVSNGYGAFLEFENTATQVFENDGQARFAATEWGIDDIEQGRAALAFDFDLDGDEDLLIVHHGAPPVLYRNDLPKTQVSLQVRVNLGPMNPRGLGCEVRLSRPDGPTQVRLIGGHSHFGAHALAEARFAVPSREGPYSLEVWLHGQLQHRRALDALPPSGCLTVP